MAEGRRSRCVYLSSFLQLSRVELTVVVHPRVECKVKAESGLFKNSSLLGPGAFP